jgi:hypothetical protein
MFASLLANTVVSSRSSLEIKIEKIYQKGRPSRFFVSHSERFFLVFFSQLLAALITKLSESYFPIKLGQANNRKK